MTEFKPQAFVSQCKWKQTQRLKLSKLNTFLMEDVEYAGMLAVHVLKRDTMICYL